MDRDGVYTEMFFDRAFVTRNGMKYYNCSTPMLHRFPDIGYYCGAAYPHLYEEKQVYDLNLDPTEQVNIWNM